MTSLNDFNTFNTINTASTGAPDLHLPDLDLHLSSMTSPSQNCPMTNSTNSTPQQQQSQQQQSLLNSTSGTSSSSTLRTSSIDSQNLPVNLKIIKSQFSVYSFTFSLFC